jgi:hypothetical protein
MNMRYPQLAVAWMTSETLGTRKSER